LNRAQVNSVAALHIRGVMLPEGTQKDLFVVDGRITFTPPLSATTVLDGGYVIPGLVDAHAHLGLASPAPPNAAPEQHVKASARAHLDAGVLLVREPGGPDRVSTGIGVRDGLPRIITAGRFLASMGGYFPGLAREVPDAALPDAAAEEAQMSGAWAKVIGDWVDEEGNAQVNFRSAILGEAVQRVHALGARLAIHVTSSEAIDAAIEAGVDSIEHAIGLRDHHLATMAARGVVLVPTLIIAGMLASNPQIMAEMGWGPARVKVAAAACEQHPEMIRRAVEAGVVVLAGTDAGMGPHGMIREEIRNLLNAGVPQEKALAAGSWEARRYLGLPGLEEGAPADIVAFTDDPRRHVEVLARPSLRILDGHLIPTR